MQTLTFQNITLSPVATVNDGQIWLSSSDLAKALGYADVRSIANIYNRNKEEFTSGMTTVIKLITNGINGSERELETRIFSLRGCHLIAMFARTTFAKEFRKWVLDILDKEVGQPVQVKTTTNDRTPLRQAVSMLVGKRGLDYSTAYTLVHQYMGVSHIDEIPLDDLPKAVAYVHSLLLNDMASNKLINNAQHLAWHTEFIYSWYKAIEEPFRALSPRLSAQIHDHIIHAKIASTGISKAVGFGGMNPAVIDKQVWSVGFDGLRF